MVRFDVSLRANMRMFTAFFWLSLIVSGFIPAYSHEYKVFCYFGSWSIYRPGKGGFNISDIDATLCTHMVYAFVGITPDGEVQVLDEYRDLSTDGGLGGFEEFNALRNQNTDLKTLVSIGGWNQGSLNFSHVVSNSTLRSTFVKNALEFVLKYDFNGLDVDWEYPAQRGGAETDVENFVLLLEELRALFDEYDLILSAALGASEGTASLSYDIPGISKYLDIVNIMEYDFHGSWDNFTGHNTPLYAATRETTPLERTLNINASIHYWLDQGASPEKLLLGTAMYGKTWTLANSSLHTPGSPVSGVGDAGSYTEENGTLAYYEILENEAQGNWTVVFDEEQRVPYAYSGDQWVTYDNVKSLTEKANYVTSLGLGGVSIWALDLDDFRGLYGEKYPLVKTMNEIIDEGSFSSSNKMAYNHTLPETCNAGLLGPSLANMCNVTSDDFFLSILEKFVGRKQEIAQTCDRIKPIQTPDSEYDFIVVGGGAAGSVIAARLSENPSWKILLMEAGSDEPVGASVPVFDSTVFDSSIEWGYQSTNESYACLSSNGSCSIAAAKTLGGGMAHNAMIYLRGSPWIFDQWAAMGNEGWSWEDVLPFFKMSENNGDMDSVDREYHGTDGPLFVERFPSKPPFANAILEAAEEAGFGVSNDLNGNDSVGFAVLQTTSHNGARRSSAATYLRPIRHRKNLHITLNSTCTRVVIENGQAVAVEYYKNGNVYTVRALKEVMVSAGAVGSPHLLLLSGVGPKEDLTSMGIDVVKDLPGVGMNFHDHMIYLLTFTINEPDVYDNNWAAVAEYIAFQTGPLSNTGLNQLGGALPSGITTPELPDIHIFGNGYDAVCAPGEIGALRSDGKREILLFAGYEHPKCRGRISLTSPDPFEYPSIWVNYLCDPDDVAGVVRAIEYSLQLVNTTALKAYNMTLAATPLEGCSDYTFASREYWECAVHYSATGEYHIAGSCKMGPSSDPLAVVDPRLRVYGIQGLRVAGASIMPQVTTANTGSSCVMIGEQAAHMIKQDWNYTDAV